MKQIRSSKFSKFLAYYLAIMTFLQVTQPLQMYALTSGPTQPEFNAFTPIGTSDMVDLASGDFNYNIPIMDVGGYPINLAYNSGVTMDQEASWVGLGWNLNVGQIDRQVRGLPDDFRGDKITYATNLRNNRTVGFNFRINGQVVGFENAGSIGGSAGLSIQHNNYTGISATPTFGFTYEINKHVSVGMNLSASATEGTSVSPYLSTTFLVQENNKKCFDYGLNSSIGLSFNSRQGLQNYNLNSGISKISKGYFTNSVFFASRNNGVTSGNLSVNLIDNTFTPSIRNEFVTFSGAVNASLGPHAWFSDLETGVGGFFSLQILKDKTVEESAYGYENTSAANKSDLLDFNRENDRVVSKNTRALAVTNYTYDTYTMQTQGISGGFRPYQSQVGYVFDAKKQDKSMSGTAGFEYEMAWGIHAGVDLEFTQSSVRSGLWGNPVVNYFNASPSEKLDYESTYFKLGNDFNLDSEIDLFTNKLHDSRAMDFKLYNANNLSNKYRVKNSSGNYELKAFTDKIKRSQREKRNQTIYKFTSKESDKDPFIAKNPSSKDHHTAGFKAINNDGTIYVFGETIYNKTKEEVTFAVHKNTTPLADGIITYSSNDASLNNDNGIDHYYNNIKTPAYANTYLLTTVLSADYEDTAGDGPTDNDLGNYTKFEYKTYGDYQWRAPYFGASYNPGFNSDRNHKKASYTYGVKESKYISKIETKTHVAFFELSPRKDGFGVNGKDNLSKNQNTSSVMYKIDRIKLYSKPEAQKANLLDNDPDNDLPLAPIKTAHFEYNYDLCKNIHNNNLDTQNLTDNEESNNAGKLTLKKVYFTYRNSNMGKYTPYVFKYDENNLEANPDYDMKSFDVWGNYKKNEETTGRMLPNDVISSIEFPYVEQDKAIADKNTACWNLKSIQLPSGGEIKIETESDDYQYVQNKRAMEMFKVTAITRDGGSSTDFTNILFNRNEYNGTNEAKRLIIEVDQDYSTNPSAFFEKYIGEHRNNPIFFRFMLNMANGQNDYDYVEGYFKIDKDDSKFTFPQKNGKFYAGIPMELTDMEGGTNGNKKVNPISKAGWYFGRQNMNKTVYGLNNDPSSENVLSIIQAISSSMQDMFDIFRGPNGKLRNVRGCAQKFLPEKSWIRLQNPTKKKLGGGSRVVSVKLSDKWDNMLTEDFTSQGTNLNSMEYGQEYSYTSENGGSSGVATFEPLGAKDNPIILPMYDNNEKLIAPKETNYTEKPFGISFYPTPTVTYSQVTVKNLSHKNDALQVQVKKHATGYIVNEFYTSKDFPTITDFTEINNGQNLIDTNPNGVDPAAFLEGLLGLPVFEETKLTISQGFSVETNDMNGKTKSQKVYSEKNELISMVDYKYNTNGLQLNNNLLTIDSKGNVSDKLIGVNYDVINDFRENLSKTEAFGIKANVSIDILPLPVLPFFYISVIPTVFPSMSTNNNELRMATTMKVIQKKGVLVETIAYDLGSTVSTKNLAWDADSGQVLLTETVNEYNDHYYSFNYPAYWMYSGMGLASTNIGIEGILSKSLPTNPTGIPQGQASNNPYFKINGENDLSKYFHLGDELAVNNLNISPASGNVFVNKLWVVGFNEDKSGILLMDRNGNYVNKCDDVNNFPFKIVRSGYRNLQSASMASVTSMINPLRDTNNDGHLDFDVNAFAYDGDSNSFNPRIINASAVVYKDFWRPQGEGNTGTYPDFDNSNAMNYIQSDGNVKYPYLVGNPYIKNIKGDWRAKESFAYLTGRNSGNGIINNPRNEGFYKDFSLFYTISNGEWITNDTKWTSASSITKYSPYGVELENEDALHRFSSAQYGYKYTLPMAVASNSKYSQMGFEGFEETVGVSNLGKHFPFQYNYLNEDTQNSHTGKKSVKVENGQKVVLTKNYKNSPYNVLSASCPIENTGGDCTLTASGVLIGNPNSTNNFRCFSDSENNLYYCYSMPVNLNGFQVQNIEITPVDPIYQGTTEYSSSFTQNQAIISYLGPDSPWDVWVRFTDVNGNCCSTRITINTAQNNMNAQPSVFSSCTSVIEDDCINYILPANTDNTARSYEWYDCDGVYHNEVVQFNDGEGCSRRAITGGIITNSNCNQ